ncbi:hypothetical protein H2509_11070 [Stappia sp. F7233]|uniref:SPW repeat-containing integral membrane domain-containing protein n=1 Tax=Stappia albiluteola TaxID=2758565 RepID=A0A839AFE7_9HYPH|nr:hypothetical protein [Stappia albiluteola]MBA5777664.1 hypothetical protein [Stappia albiluteola]
MDPRFVTQKIHSWLDYPVAISLIVMPFLLGLGTSNPFAMWLAVGTGVAALILTLLTDHETGLIRVLPYSFHLLVDGIVGLTFLAAPFLFGFSGLDAWYYWANGIAVVIVVGLHKPAMAAMAAAR